MQMRVGSGFRSTFQVHFTGFHICSCAHQPSSGMASGLFDSIVCTGQFKNAHKAGHEVVTNLSKSQVGEGREELQLRC
jgi:hypothetical protein